MALIDSEVQPTDRDTGYSPPKPPQSSGGNFELLQKIKRWYRADREFSANWRREARTDFDYVAGEQWSEADKAHLQRLMRPIITFNRIQPIINSISGHEIGNRQEVRYLPREQGDVKPNEVLTEGARWFRDLADADDEDSDLFLNATICGMGWTETTLDYEQDEEGIPQMDSVNPLEMFWDRNARKKNLTDADRVGRVRSMSLQRARELFPDASPYDLDASWAKGEGDDGEIEDQDREDLYIDEKGDPVDFDHEDRQVTIVHYEWKVRETMYVVVDPKTGKRSEMAGPEYKKFRERALDLGLPVFSKQVRRLKVMQAFVGARVLYTGPALCKTHFRYQCVTAYQDKNKGTFYGMVRGMRDPQQWANKWLSQALDLLNSQVKGGVIMEEGAVEDQRQFEATWARADKPTIVRSGALSGAKPKIQPKPQGVFPAGFIQLMEFAVSSVRDVPGVSVEMLGMREANQPASLEYQRRQAGMTILAPLFSNLKRYRHDHGELMLYIIQNYLSDGRLIRIMGKEREQFVPLTKQADLKYDIIVDDMPNSPNQKELVWSMIGDKFWSLPPMVMLALSEYSPFPSTVIQKVREAVEGMSNSPQAQMQQQMMQLEAKLKEVETALKGAQVGKTQADAQLSQARAMATAQEAQQPMQDNSQQLQVDAMLRQMDIAARTETEREGREMQRVSEQEKMIADAVATREKMDQEARLQREKMATEADTKMSTSRLQANVDVVKAAMQALFKPADKKSD